MTFARYTSSEWEGYFSVHLGSSEMHWPMEAAYDDDGELSLQGMTSWETADVWGDVFWFILLPHATPPRIEFWGDRVLCRTDFGRAAA